MNKADNRQCEAWAKSGECENNAGYMHSNCAKACGCPGSNTGGGGTNTGGGGTNTGGGGTNTGGGGSSGNCQNKHGVSGIHPSVIS